MTAKYLMALGILALLSLFDYRLIEALRRENSKSSVFVVAALRQESLLSRIALLGQYLSDTTNSASRNVIRADLLESVAELERTNRVLSQSGLTPDRNASNKFAAQMDAYVREARKLGATLDADLRHETNHLATLRRAITDDRVLAATAHIIETQKARNDRNTNRLESALFWDQIVTMCALAGTGLGIFRPMVRRIDTEVRNLENAEAYSRAIIDTAIDGVITCGQSGMVESVNPAAARIFKLDATEVFDREMKELVPSIEAAAERSGPIEMQGRRTDGSVFPMEVSATRTRLADRCIEIAFVRDVTERKRLEQQKLQAERLAVIGAMSANLAHEIRNPLGSITLNLELLRDELDAVSGSGGGDPVEVRSLLGSIASEVKRIQRVAEGYLRFARMPQGRRSAESLNEMLARRLVFMKSAFKEAGITLRTEFAPDLPRVECDAEQLWQAVLNLLRNAMEAMPGGGVLTVRTLPENQGAALSIIDSGAGLTDEQLGRLFQPFFTTKNLGTGLGLALVQQITTEHGGSVDCQSTLGKGAAFTLHLPPARVAPG